MSDKIKQYDERDTIFSRMSNLNEDSEYYLDKQELKETDKELRKLREIKRKPTEQRKLISKISGLGFSLSSQIRNLPKPVKSDEKTALGSKKDAAVKIKEIAKLYGADVVGITKTKEHHFYSHRGRPFEVHGVKVENKLAYSIVIGVKMKGELTLAAPRQHEDIAVGIGYFQGTLIARAISEFLANCGYESKAHSQGNYDTIVPLMAYDAGVGQFGKNGIIVNKELGSAMRLSAVTTDLELQTDERIDYGLLELCELCGKCAAYCPGQCMDSERVTMFDGVTGYKVNAEKCYAVWCRTGGDCGLCLACCPLSVDTPDEIREGVSSEEGRIKLLKWFDEKYPKGSFGGRVKWLDKI